MGGGAFPQSASRDDEGMGGERVSEYACIQYVLL